MAFDVYVVTPDGRRIASVGDDVGALSRVLAGVDATNFAALRGLSLYEDTRVAPAELAALASEIDALAGEAPAEERPFLRALAALVDSAKEAGYDILFVGD